jgi:hypothetical protein
MGHEDQFRPPSRNGGCRFGQGTFAGMGGKEEDAPIPVVRVAAKESPPGPSAAGGFGRSPLDPRRLPRLSRYQVTAVASAGRRRSPDGSEGGFDRLAGSGLARIAFGFRAAYRTPRVYRGGNE